MTSQRQQFLVSLAKIQDRGLSKQHLAMLHAHWRIAKYGNIDITHQPMALSAIATWSADPRDSRGHFAFTMRAELADALMELGLTEGAEPPNEANDILEALEGEEYEVYVKHRKREQRLRQQKIADVLKASSDGRLRCEVPRCGFDFEAVYGATGAGYAHVHHLKPLSSRAEPERTRLNDLVVVCANCHSMIHRFRASRPLETLIPEGP